MSPVPSNEPLITVERFRELDPERQLAIRQSAKTLATTARLAAQNGDYACASSAVAQLLKFFPQQFDLLEINPLTGIRGALCDEASQMLKLAFEELCARDTLRDAKRLCASLARVDELIPAPPGSVRPLRELLGLDELGLSETAIGIDSCAAPRFSIDAYGDRARSDAGGVITIVRTEVGSGARQIAKLLMPSGVCLGSFNSSGNVLLLTSNGGPGDPATGSWVVYLSEPGSTELAPRAFKMSDMPCQMMCASADGSQAAVVEPVGYGKGGRYFRLQEYILTPYRAPEKGNQVVPFSLDGVHKIYFNADRKLLWVSAERK